MQGIPLKKEQTNGKKMVQDEPKTDNYAMSKQQRITVCETSG